MENQKLFMRISDMSAGQFSNQYPTDRLYMPDNAGALMYDIDVDELGRRRKRKGYALTADEIDTNPIVGLVGYNPPGGSRVLVAECDGDIFTWDGSASTWTSSKTGLTTQDVSELLIAKGLLFRLSQTDDIWSFDGTSWTEYDGITVENGGSEPPQGKIGLWTSNQRFLLGNTAANPNFIWPSDAGEPATFGDAAYSFGDRDALGVTGMFEFTDGEVMVLTRNYLFTWLISDTDTTKWIVKKVSDVGCVAQRTVKQIGPDALFLSQDGVRGVIQSAQDKKRGESMPISFPIQDWISRINWSFAHKACAAVWNDKYFLSVPIDAATENNYVLVFSRRAYESNGRRGGWTVYRNWSISDFTTFDFNNIRRLYGGDFETGKVYMLRSDRDADNVTNDDGTDIELYEEGKRLEFETPFMNKLFSKIEVECEQEAAGTLKVLAQIDGEGYQEVGEMELDLEAPRLPINLPFSLVGGKKVRKEFFIEGLGRGRDIQILLKEDTPDSAISILGYTITAHQDQVEFE